MQAMGSGKAVFLGLFLAASAAGQVEAQGAKQVTVSCYRGPWVDVIWDRPNAIFIETLTGIGLSSEKALAIGTIVCRDERIVGDEAAMARRTIDLIAEATGRSE